MKNILGWTTIEQAKQLVLYGLSVRTNHAKKRALFCNRLLFLGLS